MKTTSSLTVFVCLVLLAAIAVVCILGAFRVLNFSDVLQYLGALGGIEIQPVTGESTLGGLMRLGVLGVALAVLVLMGLFGLRPRSAKGQISFVGAGGEVTVATEGLEDFIRRATSLVQGVRETKARVRQKGNDLDVDATVVLGGGRPVMDATEEIQNRIRNEIEQRLGLPKVDKVHVHVSRMDPEYERSSATSPGESDEE